MEIIFVCRQNVFRSMSAEYLAKLYAKKNKVTLEISSAGTHASPDFAYNKTYEVLSQHGVDVSKIYKNHTQTKLKHVAHKDAIFICMTKEQVSIVKELGCKEVYLFNDIAFHENTNLFDDVETNSYSDLDVFITQTVNHIAKGIPLIFKNLTIA